MAYGHTNLVAIMLHLVALASLTGSTEHVVGGDHGWSMGVDYVAWAKEQQFFIGDTLVFNYRKGDHDVSEVDKAAFAGCTVPPGTEVLKTGSDVVTLSAQGERWFVCGLPSHCSVGDQKLAVTVWPQTASPEHGPYASLPTSTGNREGGTGSYVVMVVLVDGFDCYGLNLC